MVDGVAEYQYGQAESIRLPDPRRSGSPALAGRLVGLDGLRGLAALFVVLHHCWLLSFPGFPANNGPLWASPLIYGHLAVGIFIVISGFSLAVSPARHDWKVGSLPRFAHRRAWRILPPYWMALAGSLLVSWWVVVQPGEARPTLRSVLAFGLLAQDVVGSPSPNGALWSIAIEAQLYLLFPLLILLLRRVGAVVMLVAVTATVLVFGVLSPRSDLVHLFSRFNPQYGALFAMGIVAAGIIVAGDRVRLLPWPWLSLLAIAPLLATVAYRGSEWAVGRFFWLDLAMGPAVGLLLAGLATGRPRPLVRILDSWSIRELGSFSYSLYLTHAPIVVFVRAKLLVSTSGVGGFLLTLAIAVPISLVVARFFAAAFEIPFTRHRSWPELRGAVRNRLARPSVSPQRPPL